MTTPDPQSPYTIEHHLALRRVTELAGSPCGSWLAVSVQRLDREGAKYVSDLWKVPTDGSAATQLTRGDSKDTSPCFRHDGSLGFLSNRSPTEGKPDDEADQRMQVWLMPREGGEPRQLTDEPLGVDAFRFAKNADCLAYFASVLPGIEHGKQRETAAQRAKKGPSARRFRTQPVRHWDHWLHDNANLECTHLIGCDGEGENRVDLTPDARREFAIEPSFDVSADGSRVVVTRQTAGKDREIDVALQVLTLATRESCLLGVADGVEYGAPLWSPDGTRIAAVRSTRSAAAAMRPLAVIFDAASGEMRSLGANWDRWPTLYAWSLDGKHLVVTADDAGHTPIYSMALADGAVERITSVQAGGSHSDLGVLRDGRVAGIRSTLLDPPECFVAEAKVGSLPRAMASLSLGSSASSWAQVESMTVRSTDGVPVHSWFVKPKGSGARRLPLLFWIHGGPIGMDTDGWHWRWNPLLLVAQGYAVALPNPRGSTGFGQDFVQGIWGNVWGDQCYRDLMAIADALGERSDVDMTRAAAMGGSFGGYMTNWIATQTRRFKCLVTHASIVTMAQFTGTTDHPAFWYLEMGGENPYADRERFDRYAPIRYVSEWKTPVLIIHGELDYRCPIGEALNLFEALQYHGVSSELLVFPDENHWILKPRNAVAWYEAVIEYVGRHLGEK